MPLLKGKSKKAFEHNIKAEAHAGKPIKQAVAIAYSMKRKAGKKMAEGGSVDSAKQRKYQEKGVHQAMVPWKKGQSAAGALNQAGDKESAKTAHQLKLEELKGMKKPKLLAKGGRVDKYGKHVYQTAIDDVHASLRKHKIKASQASPNVVDAHSRALGYSLHPSEISHASETYKDEPEDALAEGGEVQQPEEDKHKGLKKAAKLAAIAGAGYGISKLLGRKNKQLSLPGGDSMLLSPGNFAKGGRVREEHDGGFKKALKLGGSGVILGAGYGLGQAASDTLRRATGFANGGDVDWKEAKKHDTTKPGSLKNAAKMVGAGAIGYGVGHMVAGSAAERAAKSFSEKVIKGAASRFGPGFARGGRVDAKEQLTEEGEDEGLSSKIATKLAEEAVIKGMTYLSKGGEVGCPECCDGMPCEMHGEESSEHELDMVGKTLAKRRKMLSMGGKVSNEDMPEADFEPNEFDYLEKEGGMEFHETEANSGDDDGAGNEKPKDDLLKMVLAKRKQRNPRPA